MATADCFSASQEKLAPVELDTAIFGVALIVIGLNTAWSSPAPPRVTLAVDPCGGVGLRGSF